MPSDDEIVGAIGVLSALAAPETVPVQRAIAVLRRLLGRSENTDTDWEFGLHKKIGKWERQMSEREWTKEQISETIRYGKKYEAPNNVRMGEGTATRYEFNGRYVVRDDQTRKLLQISEPEFKRPPKP